MGHGRIQDATKSSKRTRNLGTDNAAVATEETGSRQEDAKRPLDGAGPLDSPAKTGDSGGRGLNFRALKIAIGAQFERMQKYPLFRVTVEPDAIWKMYLESFPSEANQIYRVRAEHDCSCCKGFIRKAGDVVAVIDSKIVSLWDVKVPGYPAYQQVCDSLARLIHGASIRDKFLHYERTVGTDKNFEQIAGDVKTWDHFFVNIAPRFVAEKAAIPTAMADPRESKNVFLRSLTEITDEALDTALELIAQGSLYRGEEHKFAIESFCAMKRQFSGLTTDTEREIFAWTNSATVGSVARIRNTVIGTLLVDLSNGVDLDQAVKAFEVKVAPANYKRPTALVTKAMIESAKATVEELGLTSALKRRHATVHDIAVTNIVFANRSVRKAIEGNVFDTLSATSGVSRKSLDRIEEVPIEKFIADILPRVESVEVMVENRHGSNLVSLIAPEDPTSGELFKWGNRFSWSYNGEMADSIKERVKAAGGSVVGDLCCRLAWDYADDLDFHMHEPGKGHIYYGNRRQVSPCGGILDLDANGTDGPRADPAENIYYPHKSAMREGIYQLEVNNFARRSDGRGFIVEIEFDGQTNRIEFDKVIGNGNTTIVAKIEYSKKTGFSIIESLPSSQTSREVWGLTTQNFHPVNLLMLSPNFWDEKTVGNKHYFFMIDGCRNDGAARGFFNEFLKADLDRHRKVLEMVGSRVKVDQSDDQLSGLGFSSTVRNHAICRVKGSFTRTIKIVF